MEKMYPRKFSHIGMSVKNIEEVVRWYSEVLGFYVLMPVTDVNNEADTAIGVMCQDVFGNEFQNFKIAHLSTVDGIGIELFEFPEAKEMQAEFAPYNLGVFHICIQDPNIEELAQTIVNNGGKQRMPIREYYPGEKPYKMVYMEDPFGNIIELYTHSYELHYSAGVYQ
ncbi:VOC family protein [Mollicutes bacterium LVI A0039]|nr:VOC family protein [Mollicutes bacterium LVI A0039]